MTDSIFKLKRNENGVYECHLNDMDLSDITRDVVIRRNIGASAEITMTIIVDDVIVDLEAEGLRIIDENG